MAGAGNVLGGQFEDLRDIISHINDKSRVGVCLDTCHAFAAGHDLRTASTYAATMAKFDEIIGLKYLRALHINDSKAPLGSNRDLHANIGTGFLGLEAFRLLVNDERLHGIPMVLETPLENNDTSRWAEEIKLLEGMVGKGPEDILEDVERLQKLGENERNRVMEQVEKKIVKDKKAAEKGTVKKARKKKVEETDEEMEADAGEEAKPKRGRKKVKKEEPNADEDEVQATSKLRARRGRKKVKEETEDESGCESC